MRKTGWLAVVAVLVLGGTAFGLLRLVGGDGAQARASVRVPVSTKTQTIDVDGGASGMNVDDLAFLKSLAARVDPGRQRPLYLAGFSNGARLAYRVACTDPGEFDAYAMVKGVPMTGCRVRQPVTLIQLASADDPEIPYKPGEKGLEPLPVTTEMAALRGSDQCQWTTAVTHAEDVALTAWSGCAAGSRLGLAVWQAGEHNFPRPPVTRQGAAAVIWSFLTNTTLAPLP